MNFIKNIKFHIQELKRYMKFYKEHKEYFLFNNGEVIFMPKWVYYYCIPIWWWKTYFMDDIEPPSRIGKWIYNILTVPVRHESKKFYNKIVNYN